jgi:hypothetical protein
VYVEAFLHFSVSGLLLLDLVQIRIDDLVVYVQAVTSNANGLLLRHECQPYVMSTAKERISFGEPDACTLCRCRFARTLHVSHHNSQTHCGCLMQKSRFNPHVGARSFGPRVCEGSGADSERWNSIPALLPSPRDPGRSKGPSDFHSVADGVHVCQFTHVQMYRDQTLYCTSNCTTRM